MFQRVVPITALLLLGLALSVTAGNLTPATDHQDTIRLRAASYQLDLASATEYHGNIKSKKFHKNTCQYFNCKNCTKVFKTRDEAMKAGYEPCKICKP